MALDSEHRLVVSALVGKQSAEHVDLLVEDFHRRTQGRLMNLMISDETGFNTLLVRHKVPGVFREPAGARERRR